MVVGWAGLEISTRSPDGSFMYRLNGSIDVKESAWWWNGLEEFDDKVVVAWAEHNGSLDAQIWCWAPVVGVVYAKRDVYDAGKYGGVCASKLNADMESTRAVSNI